MSCAVKKRLVAVGFFFSVVFLFANRSTDYFNQLKEQKLQPVIQTLSSESTLFPYNIILNFGKENEAGTFYIIIFQEDFNYFFKDILQLSQFFQENPPSYPVKMVLTANNFSLLPESLPKNTNSGTKRFISAINKSLPNAVLIINKAQNSKTQIIPASFAKITPLWLLQALQSAIEKKEKLGIRATILYRLGIIGKNPIYHTFLDEEIPSIVIETEEEKLTAIIPHVVKTFENNMPITWDRHYSLFYFPGQYFYIGETVTVFIILATIGTPLFFIFIFSFLFGSNRNQRINDLKKTWYLIPIMIIGTGTLLFLGQILATQLFPIWEHTIIAAGILKIVIAAGFFTMLTLLQRRIHFPKDDYIYRYLLILISMMNIFIFSALNLSLFFNFLLIFILAYVSTLRKNFLYTVFFAFLMTLPILYFIFFSDRETIEQTIYFFFTLPFWGNVLFACMLLPYEIIWITLFVRLQLFGKQEMRRFPYIIASAFTLSVIFFAGITLYGFSIKDTFTINAPQVLAMENPAIFTTQISETSFFDKSRIQLKLESRQESLHYNISTTTQEGISVYDANFPYEISSDYTKSVFLLDDYPPQTLVIDYSSDLFLDKEIQITAYYQNDAAQIISETKTLIVTGKKTATPTKGKNGG